jgi:hypothetical protein
MESNDIRVITGDAIEKIKHHLGAMTKEYEALQAKCDRYEAALKEIRTGKVLPHLIAKMALEKNDNEALAGEGENPGMPEVYGHGK